MSPNADDRPLAGRVALVAGATRGAGRAIAIDLDGSRPDWDEHFEREVATQPSD